MTELWDGVVLNVPFFNHYLTLLNNETEIERFTSIICPVLAISGKYDFGLPQYLWSPAKPIISDLTQVYFEDAGHNPMIEVPEKFTDTIIEWINSKN